MKALTCITTIIMVTTSLAQDTIIPTKYEPIKEIFGDLDKDGVVEKVVVYNMNNKEVEAEGTDREIIIYRQHVNKWVIWHRSKAAIGNSKDGGMMGDPLEDVQIKNGILLISQSGGSSWKWGHIDKYRYQDNAFELIGFTSNYGKACEYWEHVDFNLMTGKIAIAKEYENCDNERQIIHKTEKENFSYRLKNRIILENRKKTEVKIISPKYHREIYL